MKKRKFNYRSMVTALLVGFSLTISVSSIANGWSPEKSGTELKFIGSAEHGSLFQLNLNNTETDTYTISINDVYGNQLYSDRVKGINISKRFRLDSDELGDETLRVSVRSAKSNKVEVYEIKRSSRIVEEATVSRL